MKLLFSVIIAAVISVAVSAPVIHNITLKSGSDFTISVIMNTSSTMTPVEYIWFGGLPSYAVANGSVILGSAPLNTDRSDIVCVKYGDGKGHFRNYLVQLDCRSQTQGTLPNTLSAGSGLGGSSGNLNLVVPAPDYDFLTSEPGGFISVKPNQINQTNSSISSIRSCEGSDFSQVISVKVSYCNSLESSLPTAEADLNNAKEDLQHNRALASDTQLKIDQLTAKQEKKSVNDSEKVASLRSEESTRVLPTQPILQNTAKLADLQARLATVQTLRSQTLSERTMAAEKLGAIKQEPKPVKELDNFISQARKSVVVAQKALSGFKSQAAQVGEAISRNRERAERARLELEKAIAEQLQLESINETLGQTIQTVGDQIASQQSSVQRLEVDLNNLRILFKDASTEKESQSVVSGIDKKIGELDVQIGDLKGQITAINAAKEGSVHSLTDLNQRKEDPKQSDVAELADPKDLEKVRGQLAAEKSKLADLKKWIVQSQQSVKAAEGKVKDLKDKLQICKKNSTTKEVATPKP